MRNAGYRDGEKRRDLLRFQYDIERDDGIQGICQGKAMAAIPGYQ